MNERMDMPDMVAMGVGSAPSSEATTFDASGSPANDETYNEAPIAQLVDAGLTEELAADAPVFTEADAIDAAELSTLHGDSFLESRAPAVDLPPLEFTPPTEVASLAPIVEESPIVEVPAAPDTELSEEAIAKNEIAEDISSQYAERLGIKKEDLEGIEGFERLSRGQQRQILENLTQLAIGRISDEAADAQGEEFAAKQKDANFARRIWNGLKNSFTKEFDTVNREKKMAKEIEKGGMATHEIALKQMVKGMNELGPAIEEAADGTLEVRFIETEGMTPELARVAKAFNDEGTKLSRIPHEWGLESASKEQREAYQKAKETYELQRDVMMRHMSAAGGEEMAIRAMAKTEGMISMQRFIQSAPDAAEELKKIEDQNAWTAALKSVGTERGAYMALGAIGRTALAGMGAFVAAPAVAAASGAIRGWRREAQAILSEERMQREGKQLPDTPEMKAAAERMAKINDELAHIDDERVKSELVAELGDLGRVARGTRQNMIAAVRAEGTEGLEGYRGSVEKIDGLMARMRDAALSGEDTSKLAAQLRRRIDYTNLKIAEEKMIFGDKNDEVANKYALTRAMIDAESLLAGESAVDAGKDTAERRLGKLLQKTDAEIESAEWKRKAKKAAFSGTVGGVLAVAGAEIADAIKYMRGADGTLTETLVDKAAEIKGAIIGNPTPSGVASTLEYVDGTRGLTPPVPNDINGLDLPPDYQFPVAETPINGHDLPPDYAFPQPEANWVETPSGMRVLAEELDATREVKSGDSLSKILAEALPEKNNTEIIAALRAMSPEELKSVGVVSGNPDLIHPGERIDIGKMKAYLDAHAHTPSGISSTSEYVDGSRGIKATLSTEAPKDEWVETRGGLNMTPEDIDAPHPSGTGLEEPAVATGKVESLGEDTFIGKSYPERRIASLTDEEIRRWPSNKPLPWPVTLREARAEFDMPSDFERAQMILEKVGRFPNDHEMNLYHQYERTNPGAAKALLDEMKKAPMSNNQLNAFNDRVSTSPLREAPSLPRNPVIERTTNSDGTITESRIVTDVDGQSRTLKTIVREDSFGGRWIESQDLDITSLKDSKSIAYADAYMRNHGGRVPSMTEYVTWRNEQYALERLGGTNPSEQGVSAREAKAIADFDPEGMDKVGRRPVVPIPQRPPDQAIRGVVRDVGQISTDPKVRAATGAFGKGAPTTPIATAGTVIGAIAKTSADPKVRAVGDILGKLGK